ncbi:hypothetical protein [Fictibacillus sp. 18YEL24]|uniref:hypothetical protein n=1 Tax=Fictibacillus sp. 18YEL24 TaxID=2745875 RepID=UPI0018CE6DD7|nr:hypothetical protein [Fictibacillus sp. 18YEL24]MBH0170993.1 hypothetical protein [Fictibacillus sp. 18YEL24]
MVKGKSRKRIKKDSGPSPKKALQRGTEPNQSDSPLTFDFSNKNWLMGVSQGRFTNKLSDESMYAAYLTEIFHKLIPNIQQNWLEIIRTPGRGSWRHCHQVDNEKIDLVLAITEQIHGHQFRTEKTAGPSLWQFGVTQNIRLFAIHDYTNNHLVPLFVDYHHLVHPNKNFNQPDYERYSFCPISVYMSS